MNSHCTHDTRDIHDTPDTHDTSDTLNKYKMKSKTENKTDNIMEHIMENKIENKTETSLMSRCDILIYLRYISLKGLYYADVFNLNFFGLRYGEKAITYFINKMNMNVKMVEFKYNDGTQSCAKIIYSPTYYDAIVDFNNTKLNNNVDVPNLFRILKISLNKKCDNNETLLCDNILPDLIKYLGQGNNFNDIIKLHYSPTTEDIHLSIVKMGNLFDTITFDIPVHKYNKTVDEMLTFMCELK